jgi:Tfp pilus assembly protein PilX
MTILFISLDARGGKKTVAAADAGIQCLDVKAKSLGPGVRRDDEPRVLHALGQHGRYQQRGMISTLMAIIVLVVSLLAALALMRSVDTSNTVAGSLTFRQSALQAAEAAYVDAQQKITFTQPNSDNDQSNLGYYAEPQPATSRSTGDIPDMLVNLTSGFQKISDTNGNTIYYVVERLCPSSGAATPTRCIVPGASLLGGSLANQNSDNLTFSNGAYAAFRLTVRVDGPKNTTAYVQTFMR